MASRVQIQFSLFAIKGTITNKLKSLELIDGEAVNISGQMNYSLTGLANSSSNFTTYNFRGSDYLILDIPGGYDMCI